MTNIMNELRPSSAIRRVQRNGRFVYEKEYSEGDWGRTADVVRKRLEREVGLMRRLSNSGLFGSRLGLVNVVSADTGRAGLVTEEVQGQTLGSLIATSKCRKSREYVSAMFLAGRWLARFQRVELTAADREAISELHPQDLVEYCRLRLEKLAECAYRWPTPAMRDKLLRAIARLDSQSDEKDRGFVWTHGDYSLGNIIWDGRVLTPIDFGMAHADRPLHDVTHFIHRLEMLKVYRPWQRLPLAAWRRAVLRGYGRPDGHLLPMYRALMIRHQLCGLLTYVRRPPRDLKQRLHDKYVGGVVRARLARAANVD